MGMGTGIDFENPMGMDMGMGMTFENGYGCGYSYTRPEAVPHPSLTILHLYSKFVNIVDPRLKSYIN